MQRVGIIGTGPTGLYTLAGLIQSRIPVNITLYESRKVAGVGMPFDERTNHPIMLANIASIEIPPLVCSYLEWLQQQSHTFLERYAVDKKSLHERQFLPRVLLGHYFHNQLKQLIDYGRSNGHQVHLHKSSTVTDIDAQDPCRVWVKGQTEPAHFDYLVIATGHRWPSEAQNEPGYFASPWSGLIESNVPAARVGILGSSLSGIDAAMAVAVQHGHFREQKEYANSSLLFDLKPESTELCISLLSRSGILPEADFYCPIPHQPLTLATPELICKEIDTSSQGLLDRLFELIVRELQLNDPLWSNQVALETLDADSFSDAYFSTRKKSNPFTWARKNLEKVMEDKKAHHTVAWRYTLLRLHEAIEPAIQYFNKRDRERFKRGLKRVFVDNYAAVPPESIRRILALRDAGVIDLKALGQQYEVENHQGQTTIHTKSGRLSLDILIDARGQKPSGLADLPFPCLRKQLAHKEYAKPPLNDDYTIAVPSIRGERVALAALPFLMPLKPFVQGLTECAEIGAKISDSFCSSLLETAHNEQELTND
ncbi:FAD/NAD(P)-binding protein [Gilvimarinus algae]|uniref:FAD/NAD(P)-binding protein n=1 Tax=Gilvimarinus algae TaxID=3058037 RepID=A0ABT8TC61_9GAMM|nr:FAD/NAD(P)-binding protein [Gilvimarinus sp. SDUM040014]MDO3381603.1 FAD/NAD(P)-binding protein [Gilvimarinus sp. SDUM040014]